MSLAFLSPGRIHAGIFTSVFGQEVSSCPGHIWELSESSELSQDTTHSADSSPRPSERQMASLWPPAGKVSTEQKGEARRVFAQGCPGGG